MAKVEPKKKAAGTTKSHVRLVVQVRQEHVDALIAAAEQRRKPGQVRADVSAVLRDVLDAWAAVGKRR
jgi:hypothetical protein